MTIASARLELISAARQFYQLGWMLGTAGNLSARCSPDSFWITASGKSKGNLTEKDFVKLNLAGELLEAVAIGNKPSAETSIHQTIYNLFPEANWVYHVHSVEANLVSRFAQDDYLALPPLEMLKGLGVWVENPQVTMPVFKNYLEVPRIAVEIQERFSKTPPAIPALLIVDHGVTVWANSSQQATNYLEIVEYIFRYLVAATP
jgi:methylthioribulose-1-phosphate dehydratase